ncbi:glycosyltransferase family 4 protein [Labrys wisconsinensis]|uniref:Glycosyltransferase involved in cell wall biosynthesis n=1 Tax=Labrys wisconsinensis TaxID=425677 RepID=A0ABU0JIC1_9HYPH|nr:glycosyltransferase family 1 protein [Labrys wisconsinensis]MDQ0473009.1 glycosyltransferase involved in cell wall biosynthesis [Labrys wisconsinensis]
MKILIATDAWRPQVNGVVRSLEQTASAAAALGVTFDILSPAGYATVPLPSYPEIQLALATPSSIERRIREAAPDFIHIATEGPIGFLTRRACLKRGRPFTTSYHTKFPEYIAARAPIPQDFIYRCLRRFHNAGSGTMVSTPAMERELAARGFRRLLRWSRGVDHELFRPRAETMFDLPRPIFLSVGRVAVEKNIEAFLALDLPGSKVVVGAGPALAAMRARFPQVHFAGMLHGEALARAYASADVFVFPSLTDTFGIVLLEALASGLPVAAFPVTGPLDVIGGTSAGVLDEDLRRAALACLDIPREAARAEALKYSWEASARQFIANVRSACGGSLQDEAA